MTQKRNRSRYGAVCAVFFLLPLPIFAQGQSELIDRYVQAYHQKGLFDGAALVAKSGEVIFKKGYGLANREWDVPFEPGTKMAIGSLTKSLTSLLVMQQVEMGKIELDGKINDYLPEYRRDTGERVSIHHLLSNTSGIPDIMDYPEMRSNLIRNSYTLDYGIKHFCSGDLEFEPGSKFKYSSSGYLILGAILESVTGKSYESLLEESILKPAGMTNTGVDRDSLILKKRASGYVQKDNHLIREPYMNMDLATSAGGIYSTVEDLYQFSRALSAGKLLSKKYQDIMFEPYIGAFGGMGKYAYGWVVFEIPVADSGKAIKAVSHGGTVFGKEALLTRLVEDQYHIVIFNNTEIGQRALLKMTMDIAGILYGFPPS